MALSPGTRIGPYDIVSPLGAGGMGEVYRARDTKLGRDVAIKVLPAAFTSDADRLARFEREARLLASLNHPHIGSIYGLEEGTAPGAGEPGVRALVLELVEGEGLDEKIRRTGRMDPDEAVALAGQIADALDAAHMAGIVHRDLKPANIRVTPDGVVKVLDFGLAKSSGDAAGSDMTHSPTTVGPTALGVLLGTAPYMSPEQARGKSVDKRTDIWAFGCVLYEMLAGRRAFGGETSTEAIAAVLEREPDWTALPASTPAGVRRLLRRCLTKDPKQRLRDIGDARADLADAPAEPGAVARRRPWLPWTVAAVAVVVAVVGTGSALRGARRGPAAFEAPVIDRLTLDSGVSESPSLSADGRLLAYASTRSGRADRDIWVQQMAGGTPLRVTDDVADDSDPDLSSDGSRVVFRSERGAGGAYLVPALGGPARLIAPEARNPKLSPDGTMVAYWTGQFRGQVTGTRSATYVLPIAGGAPTRLLPDFAVARDPVWAPDGGSLLVLAMRDSSRSPSNPIDWWRVPVGGGPPVRTTVLDRAGWRDGLDQNDMTTGPWRSWGFLLAIGGTLWSQRLSPSTGLPEGEPRPLVVGAGHVFRPTSSLDGVVVFGQPTLERVIERVPITSADAPAPVRRLYEDGRPGIGRASQTRDGQTLVFDRPMGSTWEIWRKDLRTGDQHAVMSVTTTDEPNATVSPDGSRIGYTVHEGTGASVTVGGTSFIVDTAGGVPKKLCDNCGVYAFLSDNRRAVVAASDSAIRVIDITNGTTVELVGDPAVRIERPSVSPDDRWLAYRRTSGTEAKVFVMPVSGGTRAAAQQVDEPTTTGRPAGWSPDSRLLYLLLDTDGARCLWAQAVDAASGRLAGKPYVVRHFHELSVAGGFGTTLGNAVTSQGFLYEANSVRSNLFRLTPAAPR